MWPEIHRKDWWGYIHTLSKSEEWGKIEENKSIAENIINCCAWVETNMLTHIQKKNDISKEFWKRIKWMRKRTMRGRRNQKWSSDGWTTNSPSMAECFSATSWANWIITCSSLVPTASRSWRKWNRKIN